MVRRWLGGVLNSTHSLTFGPPSTMTERRSRPMKVRSRRTPS